jgi:hypothetical protein
VDSDAERHIDALLAQHAFRLGQQPPAEDRVIPGASHDLAPAALLPRLTF